MLVPDFSVMLLSRQCADGTVGDAVVAEWLVRLSGHGTKKGFG